LFSDIEVRYLVFCKGEEVTAVYGLREGVSG